MANPNELKRARRRLAEARASLNAIELLPRRVGQKVTWSNGVVWTREGDDRWRATDMVHGEPWVDSITHPSAHVAWGRLRS